jgi:hypothetical protein
LRSRSLRSARPRSPLALRARLHAKHPQPELPLLELRSMASGAASLMTWSARRRAMSGNPSPRKRAASHRPLRRRQLQTASAEFVSVTWRASAARLRLGALVATAKAAARRISVTSSADKSGQELPVDSKANSGRLQTAARRISVTSADKRARLKRSEERVSDRSAGRVVPCAPEHPWPW